MQNIFFSLYLVLILIVGVISFRKIKNSKDFFVAGSNAGTVELTGSLLATMLGSSAIIGGVNFAYGKGWAGAWFMLSAAFGLGVLYFLIDRLKDFKGYNLPELLGSFYGKEAKTLSSIIIPIAWTGIIASQIMGAAMIIEVYTGMAYANGIWISGIVFILYTALGGQLSIIKTDAIQFIFIFLGVISCFLYTSSNYELIEALPLISHKFGYKELIVMLLTYSSTYFVGPDVYSRIFCAKDDKTAKKSILICISVLVPLAFILSALGIYASSIIPDIAGKSALMHLAANVLPKPLAAMLYFGLLSAVISSADTTLLTASSTFAQVFTGDLKKENSIKITRLFILFFGLISIFIALKVQFILGSIFLAFAIYSGAFIIPTLLGIFGLRCHKNVVLTAMIVGGGLGLYGKVFSKAHSSEYIITAFALNLLIMLSPSIIKKIKS